jgi:superfamily II DNA or RNA helicase
MQFPLRLWQEACLKRFQERLSEGERTFVLEACMGAGKSAVAASIAKYLLEREQDPVDHVLVLVPWKSIQGDVEKGMLGTFGKTFGIDARDRFFTYSRRQVQQPVPQLEATITTYQEVCDQRAIDTLKMWKAKGFRFALICDEIHHANEISGTWGPFVSQMKELADYSVFMSGTFFRGDGDPISCIDTELDPDSQRQVPIKHYR